MVDENAWIDDPRTQQALVFFQRQGWSPQQATGIVSNLWHESGLDPGIRPKTGETAYGVGQWHPDRQQAYQDWSGKPIVGSSLLDQLGFVQHELTDGEDVLAKRAGSKLQQAATPAEAAGIFMRGFERPSDPHSAKLLLRSQKAEDLYNRVFGNFQP